MYQKTSETLNLEPPTTLAEEKQNEKPAKKRE
jgi:hypothetical protein